MAFSERGVFGGPVGWEDRGEVQPLGVYRGEVLTQQTVVCGTCNTVLRIGKEDGKVFKFCRRCDVKIN